MRILPAILLCLTPLTAHAQSADLLCVSVGGDGLWTQVALYGSDNTALVMAVPPEGEDAPMESRTVSLPDDAFPAMAAVLRPGLADLPPPPDAGACDGTSWGPVTIALAQSGADDLLYEAPCLTADVVALNEAMIAASGDPSGTPLREWTGPVLPAMRDICRDLP